MAASGAAVSAAGCPASGEIYVRASPLQRTRATAQALVDGAFPGCGVMIHHVSGDADPLFQTDKFAATQTDPARQLAEVKKTAGDLAQRRQALAPVIQLLKNAVCAPMARRCAGGPLGAGGNGATSGAKGCQRPPVAKAR